MKHFLIVVDIQKDFVDGALGTAEAVAMVPRAAERIAGFEGQIFVTFDTHFENYMDSTEGRKLPVPHCIKGTPGWALDSRCASGTFQPPWLFRRKANPPAPTRKNQQFSKGSC